MNRCVAILIYSFVLYTIIFGVIKVKIDIFGFIAVCKLTFLEHYCVFQGAKLSKANLKGANLQRAYLRHVNLRDAVSKTDAY